MNMLFLQLCWLIIIFILQMNETIGAQQMYNGQAGNRINRNQIGRQQKATNQVLKFNNWIKSVLISEQSKAMCHKIQRILDIPNGRSPPLLHVLDIGCGRGQDLKKWKLARVKYMVATDFSEESLKVYIDRWKDDREPYRLYAVAADFTSSTFYYQIEHSYYDIVSAQLCFHYMWKTMQGLRNGLASILSNLLVGGVFIATIPDSYVIMRKINEKGVKKGPYTIYGNKYFSLRFEKTSFTQACGNEYGFYLQDSVGVRENENEGIQYTNEYLISLDKLSEILQGFGMEIEYTNNFLDYYLEFRDRPEYKSLFTKMGLSFDQGKSMDPELWEIAHLYRVLICRKISKGKNLNEYTMDERLKAPKGKEEKRTQQDTRDRGRGDRGRSGHHSNNHYGNNHHSSNNHGNNHRSNNHYGNNNHHGNNNYPRRN